MNKLIISVMALSLAACSSMGSYDKLTQIQKIEVACTAASAAMKTIVQVHEVRPLSFDQVNQIKKAVAVVSPVCSSPTPPSLGLVDMAIFEAAVDVLKKGAGE